MFRSLGVMNYRIWFAGAMVSNIGAWMNRTAQDWLILTELTNEDAAAVGIAMALQFGPALLIGPYAGLIADRIKGRRLLAITQTAQGLVAAALGIIVVLGVAELWMVYVLAALLGVATAVDAPVRQTFVGELVGPSQLPNAVSLNSASFNTARLIGPAVAGLLIATIGSGWVIIINAVTYVATLIALALMRGDQLHVMKKEKKGRGQLRAGVMYVRRRADLVVIFTMVFLLGTFGFNFGIFTATMARVEFGRGAAEFGILSSVLAIGSVTGALMSARRERPRLRVVVLATLGFAGSTALAAVMPTYELFAVSLVLIGFTSLTMITSANAYVQTTTRPAIRGRVMALYLTIFMGGTPIGAPLLGFVANEAGPRWALGVAALAGLAAAAVAIVWMRGRANLRLRRPRGGSWWRLRVRYDGDDYDWETATTEIAVVEAQARKG
ncbi:MFS transporter [Microcella daejeonensis]|uniref:MFS transporter n=1 Tax=Microcella daejeonensis TaxID=2994971 RepID=A0A9E8MPK0_9MICO|nr:MFS transporter [Microcella daejeonensis]WAB82501.1 MFS transporter [Microcella daejeonensis]